MARIKLASLTSWRGTPQHTARHGWQARRLLRQAGPGAIAGVAAIAVAVLLQWHATQLAQRQQLLTQEINTAVHSAAAPRVAAPTSADGVAAFQAFLPAHDTIPDMLKEMVRIAEQSGITLAKAEYKPEQDAGSSFLRYRITLPVKADFPRVQEFIINVLQALPSLTLESVSFKREQIASGAVEARLQFVLLIRQMEQRP